MLKDEVDTDFRCLTAVSAYVLSVEKFELICERKSDMKKAFDSVEAEVFRPKYPIALDYIIHNNNESDYAT